MPRSASSLDQAIRRAGRPGARRAALAAVLLGSAGCLAVAVATRTSPPPVSSAEGPARPSAAAAGPSILDPRAALDPAARAALPAGPVAAAFQPAPTVFAAAAPPRAEPQGRPPADPVRTAAIPLPVPRPPELRGPSSPANLLDRVPLRQRLGAAAAPVPAEDTRSPLEKLFGIAPPSAPKLAYAALDTGPARTAPAPKLSPGPALEGGTAIYDITARAVTLPSGERLEAHSGLGDKLDDPRFVHVRMRGATPPGTYDLTEREAPFHGVRALRLNPVGGSGAVHGRAGLLAHTFMLGPKGDSNGCVSVRDYERFLQAYLRGEIRRLVVVTGSGWGAPFFARGSAPAAAPSRAGDA